MIEAFLLWIKNFRETVNFSSSSSRFLHDNVFNIVRWNHSFVKEAAPYCPFFVFMFFCFFLWVSIRLCLFFRFCFVLCFFAFFLLCRRNKEIFFYLRVIINLQTTSKRTRRLHPSCLPQWSTTPSKPTLIANNEPWTPLLTSDFNEKFSKTLQLKGKKWCFSFETPLISI